MLEPNILDVNCQNSIVTSNTKAFLLQSCKRRKEALLGHSSFDIFRGLNGLSPTYLPHNGWT